MDTISLAQRVEALRKIAEQYDEQLRGINEKVEHICN